MRSFKMWFCLFHITLICFVSNRLLAAPALTTIQDTIYKADGSRFTGVAYVEWRTFQASDGTLIGSSSVVAPILDGALRVRLVPTSNASYGAIYQVRYTAEGRVQFTETWNVPPSNTAVRISAVRTSQGSGGVTGPATVSIVDVTGLSDELAARPIKGFGYAPSRVLASNVSGAIDAVQGNLSDCIHVDGTTGPCGSVTTGNSGPGFVDLEVPTGTVNGSNTVFTLINQPSPGTSLQLYRNGVLMKPGLDFSLTANTITFGSGSTPATGDLLQASYRTAGSGALSGLASGALTGTFPNPQIAAGVINDYNIAGAAAIAESKLALNYPTHASLNDPTGSQKAALNGTVGQPSATNKYVTDQDTRLSNARTPVGHSLLSAAHSDTTAEAVQRGDLLIGGMNGTVNWSRLPLGAANRCLTSNGVDAVWNSCLFTGFNTSAIPFTNAAGTLEQSPMSFVWDTNNRRLSVGNNLGGSTLTVFDSGAGATSTTLTVRAAQAQGVSPLQVWQAANGVNQARVDSDGSVSANSVEVASTTQRAGWRETGVAGDPAVRADGDSWYNTASRTRKTVDGGQVHATPQVICSNNGSSTTSSASVLLGSCSIPTGLLQAGDRLAIRATWSHVGTSGGFRVQWHWGNSLAGGFDLAAGVGLVAEDGEAAMHAAGTVVQHNYRLGTNGSDAFLADLTDATASGIVLSLEGSVASASDSLKLVQYTVIRYPAQIN